MKTFQEAIFTTVHIAASYKYIWILVPSIGYILYRAYKYKQKINKLPPGPIGIPWLGYTPCLGKNAFNELKYLHKRYGPIVSFRLCGQLIVVLNDLNSIQMATLNRRSLIGRHTMLTNHLLADGCGISNYDHSGAITLRRSLVRSIHTILPAKTGNPHNSMQAKVDEKTDRQAGGGNSKDSLNIQFNEKVDRDIANFIKFLAEQNGQPIKINPIVRQMVWSVVWRAVFGADCPLTNEVVMELIQSVAENNSVNGPFQLKQMLHLNCSFVLSRSSLARKLFGVEEIWQRYQRVHSVLTNSVKGTFSEGNKLNGGLLSQIVANTMDKISDEDLYRLAFELMAAGVDTTTLTIIWAFHCLATDALMVSEGEPFTQEHLDIVHRMASVVPLALPHTARYDNEVNNYLIPKGSIVIFNLFAVHQSQIKTMANCNQCPFTTAEKALSESKFTSPIPFSLGSRACPGFMFATRLILRVMNEVVNRFQVKLDITEPVNGADGQTGLTRSPANELIRFISRTN